MNSLQHLAVLAYLGNGYNYALGGNNNAISLVLGIICVAILLIIFVLILGTTLGTVAFCIWKIHKATATLRTLKQDQGNIIKDLKTCKNNPADFAATATALAASKDTSKAYKAFRASSISFLIVAIIASLVLFALIAGIVLAVFFTGPGAAPILTAAMIGCCAAAGGGAILTLIGALIASFYSAKKCKQTAHHMTQALLQTAVSAIISDIGIPEDSCRSHRDMGNAIRIMVNQSLINYNNLFREADLHFIRNALLPQPVFPFVLLTPPLPPYSDDPPPKYEDLYPDGPPLS
ncbi:hypothetical protein Cs308_0824 [Candidatus Chlamydia sanziniae]|uniref:Uncharacterized protein n=2 Tax=Candidatus Chlamydia sanziniae TaxID=1806891 RepID=A0A1A9HY80_9CHLA|nr:hypothetical protein Cs308_0824 [Candidatus Chlamydia sanziniae]